MHDPYPLAITRLVDPHPLLSDTSSNSSIGSSSSNSESVSIRALVPHRSATAGVAAAADQEGGHGGSLRSEDDTALMRSLIGLLPHEQADSQVFMLPCCIIPVGVYRQ